MKLKLVALSVALLATGGAFADTLSKVKASGVVTITTVSSGRGLWRRRGSGT
jgi:glutamate/aspartate transport system substrate-binding protein